jgi:hypothetical protein
MAEEELIEIECMVLLLYVETDGKIGSSNWDHAM